MPHTEAIQKVDYVVRQTRCFLPFPLGMRPFNRKGI